MGLRLWSRSTLLKNYQMEFQGQIEKKSLSWAFRASDSANYYAAKIQPVEALRFQVVTERHGKAVRIEWYATRQEALKAVGLAE